MAAFTQPSSARQLSTLLLLSLIVTVAFALRITHLSEFPPGVSSDESVNAIDAFHIAQTGIFPVYQDFGRPDPLFRIVQAAGVTVFGSEIWSFRFISALTGTVTIAIAFWATLQCIPPAKRRGYIWVALISAATLAIAVGHVTVTRSLYRAVPQPLFTLLTIGFLARAIWLKQWRWYVLAGIACALTLYTYTAAFVIPLGMIAFAFGIVIQRNPSLKHHFIGMSLFIVVLGVLTLPISVRLLTTPESIIGRAAAVTAQQSFEARLEIMLNQFWLEGDENPQYNVALAPLIPIVTLPLFLLGLITSFTRLRQPHIVFILTLLVLSTLPAFLSEEITHGLRMFGVFSVLPIITGLGVIPIVWLMNRFNQKITPIVLGAGTITLISFGGLNTWNSFNSFWAMPDQWRQWNVYGYTLDHGEWFFRTDRRDLADWISQQDKPILLPVSELNENTTRVYLLNDIHEVNFADNTTALPTGLDVIFPYALELQEIRLNDRQFAVFNSGIVTILPPLTEFAHSELIGQISTAGETVTRQSGKIQPIGTLLRDIDTDILAFESQPQEGFSGVDSEIKLVSWYGKDTIEENTPVTVDFYLNWQASRKPGFDYNASLQVLTADYQHVASSNHGILRWLYPTTRWQDNQIVPDQHTLDIPALDAGAYRIVTNIYPTFGTSLFPTPITIGWLKVAPATRASVPASAFQPENPVQFGENFQLIGLEVTPVNAEIAVQLYWRSLTERPPQDATIFIHLLDSDGQIVSQVDTRPHNGAYPTFIWSDGEIVKTSHTLPLTESIPDDIQLRIGMYLLTPEPVNLPVTIDGQTRSVPYILFDQTANTIQSGD